MSAQPTDQEFLALLVHHHKLDAARAERLAAMLRPGQALDALLQAELGWKPETSARLRRTRAGETHELPGYELLGKLGQGGTADVFKAREKKSGQLLALKVLRPECAAQRPTLEAFIAEGKRLASLRHSGLVRGHGVAHLALPEGGELWFQKLDCIEGRTLLEELEAGQPFPEERALEIVLSVAETLDYLCAQGLVHRDIKPGNIMLDREGHPILIDLGFAGRVGADVCAASSAIGTKEYLPPEQALGGAVADARSDIYSLGVSLFHLVVGRLPFQSTDDRELLRMQVMQSLRSPELKSRGFSPHLHYFIEKMMSKDASDRYQSWSELASDIRAQLAGRRELDFDSVPPPAAPKHPRRS